jgi:alanyl-tRNA synthetase
VEVGEYSRELCGGTHVARSGQLGLVKIMGESSIGSGVRRVEALVGMDAFRFLVKESMLVSQLTEQLRAPRPELSDRIGALVRRLRDAERELQRIQSAQLANVAVGLASQAADVGGVAYVSHRAPDGTPADGLRKLALDIRGQIPPGRPGVVLAVGVPADRPAVVVAVNDAARARGITAGALIGTATAALGGRGGGKDDIAQGGGAVLGDRTGPAVQEAFDAVQSVIAGIGTAGSVA